MYIKLLMILFLASASFANAQIMDKSDLVVGAKGGLNLSDFRGDNSQISYKGFNGNEKIRPSLKIGFHGGGYIEYFLKDYLSLESGLFYSQFGANYVDKKIYHALGYFNDSVQIVDIRQELDIEFRYEFYNLPVLMNYYLLNSRNLNVKLNAGVNAKILNESYYDFKYREYAEINDQERNNISERKDISANRFNIGLLAGIGIDWIYPKGKISFDGRFEVMLPREANADFNIDILKTNFTFLLGYGIYL